MQLKEIKNILAEAGLPLTYYQWPEKDAPQLPYIVWYIPGSDNFDADNSVYQKIVALNVELYTEAKNFDAEATLEAVLDSAGLVWEKTEDYIDSERMYEVLYETSIVVTA